LYSSTWPTTLLAVTALERPQARFPEVSLAAAHYESFYLKACAPEGGMGLWLRYTVLKPPGGAPEAALWCTLFDSAAPGPAAVKQTLPADQLGRLEEGYLQIGESRFTTERLAGGAAAAGRAASWEIALAGGEPPLAHLGGRWLYRATLPRTKLCSPQPAVRASGVVTVDGRRVELDGWPGMVGHNWGTQHAERWVWLHGAVAGPKGDGWLDVAVARMRLGGRLTPWLASGALSLGGVRHALGGPGRWRATRMAERPDGCEFVLPGRHLTVRGTVRADRKDLVGWVYADPAGGSHDTVNCSIASMSLTVLRRGRAPLPLECAGGAAYELGMREHDHGISLQPFPDGPATSRP
jgi:hypothetical protein